MTRLHLSDRLVLKGEPYCWTLCEQKVYQSGAKAGESYDYDIGYFPSLRTALARALDEYVKRADATDLVEVKAAIDAFSERLSEALQPTVNVKLNQLLEG